MSMDFNSHLQDSEIRLVDLVMLLSGMVIFGVFVGFITDAVSNFMHALKEDNIQLNRKMLSELAMNEPYSFQALVHRVKTMRGL